jgi:hypothetical protein
LKTLQHGHLPAAVDVYIELAFVDIEKGEAARQVLQL